MAFFEFQEKNLDNLMLLAVSLMVSCFTTMVNNRFSANRVHNITKLFNEVLGRSNSAFAFFFLTLSIFSNASMIGGRVFQLCFVLSLVLWFFSLYLGEGLLRSLEKDHICELDDQESHFCKIELSYGKVIRFSLWNIVISSFLFLLAVILSLSKWATVTRT